MLHRAGARPARRLRHQPQRLLDTRDRPGFKDAGGYPGLRATLPNDIDGDFHSAFAGGDESRAARRPDRHRAREEPPLHPQPGAAGDREQPAGRHDAGFGRIANVPDPHNRRFYPDIGHNTIFVFDPKTGEQNIPSTRSTSRTRWPATPSSRTPRAT